jgi:hypothetical protein
MLQDTIEMIASIRRASKIKVGRNFSDFFADRIKQAATEQTLAKFAERLCVMVDTSVGELYPDVVKNFFFFAGSDDATYVLQWLRDYPSIAGMLVSIKHDERKDIVSTIVVDKKTDGGGQAIKRRPFDIKLTAECTTPLAHGGDTKAGNATLFRRMQILSSTGDTISLPFYAGNSIRGIIRDLLADHFISTIGLRPRRDKPPVSLWFFHCLYAGGALEERSAATKAINKELGKNGIANTDGVRRFRDMLPCLSLLGTALGNRIVCGRVEFGDLRPRCYEWGNGDIPVGNLFDWQFLTRREDHEDHDQHHGMIATTEVLKPGVILDGGVDTDQHISELELSALGLGLILLKEHGRIGAESRRDFGGVSISYENLPDGKLYVDWLSENKDTIVGYLGEIGAIDHDQASDKSDCKLF